MKKRLDVLLVEKNIMASRERAKEAIISGMVFVDNKAITKVAQLVEEDSDIHIEGETLKYVSRGGLKLEKAIECFKVSLHNKFCMDIGASTGGFTDCMLQNGASKVYSIDVGHDQLSEKLKNDVRVVNMENTNVRYLCPDDFKQLFDFASIDVSFISLTKVLLPIKNLLNKNGQVICLIKPQFEAGKSNLNKKGVVKEKKVHVKVINEIVSFAKDIGFRVRGLAYSPIKGPEGNIEYLLYLSNDITLEDIFIDSTQMVSNSHSLLNK